MDRTRPITLESFGRRSCRVSPIDTKRRNFERDRFLPQHPRRERRLMAAATLEGKVRIALRERRSSRFDEREFVLEPIDGALLAVDPRDGFGRLGLKRSAR